MTIVQDSCSILETQVLSQQKQEASSSSSTSMEVISVLEDKNIKKTMDIPSFNVRREGKVSLPSEITTGLERQDSCESVGSMFEEGIQVDADSESTEGNDTSSESNLEMNIRSGRSSSVVSDASEEGGRDSGIEAEREPDMTTPDEDLMTRIVAQVEFYFSDSNVAKDKFLLKHIRRNKEGYVSLKLVSSFKKIKQQTKDWRVVAHSLTKSSTKIQLNDQGSKIRRTDPLPEIDDTPVTCDVIAINLPFEKPNIANISELFGTCGDITFIRVVRSGGNIPPDIKQLTSKYPTIKDTQFAWIQFDSPDAAKLAVDLTDGSLLVISVIPETQKKQEKPAQQKITPSNSRKNSVNNNQQKGQTNSRKNSYNKVRKESVNGFDNDFQRRPHRRNAVSLPHGFSSNLQELSEARRRPKSKSCTEYCPPNFGGNITSTTSWVQRHLFAAAAASAASAASPVIGSKPPSGRISRVSQGSLPLPGTVIRFPKGPDGSRGFSAVSKRRSATFSEGITVSS